MLHFLRILLIIHTMKNVNTEYTFILLPGLDGTGHAYSWLKNEMLQSQVNESNIHILSYGNEHSYSVLFKQVETIIINSTVPVVIIAESFAGPLALSLVTAYPDKVKKLVLSATFGVKPECTFIPYFALGLFNSLSNSLIPLNKIPPNLINKILMNEVQHNELKIVMEDIYKNGTQEVFDKRIKQVLSLHSKWNLNWEKAIYTNTLIFKPLKDRLIDKSNSDILHFNLINSRLIELDAPHMLLQTNAKESWKHILKFLN